MDMENIKPFLMPGAVVIAGGLIAASVIATSEVEPEPAAVGGDQTASRVVSAEELDQTVRFVDRSQTDGSAVGDPEAPVVMYEYSDYVCPFCRRHWQETLPQLKEQYVETGDLRVVYKDFPVVGGDRAAEASRCAEEQGEFWAYHDLLYSRQELDRAQWGEVDIHLDYAEYLGLDTAELESCFEERRYQASVQAEAEEAVEAGGSGTPFFVIGDETIGGAHPFEVFVEVIESQL